MIDREREPRPATRATRSFESPDRHSAEPREEIDDRERNLRQDRVGTIATPEERKVYIDFEALGSASSGRPVNVERIVALMLKHALQRRTSTKGPV